MSGGFGELNFESSRAFADDEDEDVSENQFGLAFDPRLVVVVVWLSFNGFLSFRRLSVEWTGDGERLLKDPKFRPLFCAFDGKVALGTYLLCSHNEEKTH